VQPEAGYHLINAVMTTADVFLRESQRLFRPHGLTAAQFNLLNVVARSGSGLSQRELSDHLVVDRSNVTGLVDRIEKSGWVRRADDPTDRRIYRVQLTPAGRALWEKVMPRYLAVVAQVTRGVARRDLEASRATLERLEGAAKTWELPGAEPATR
jgi:DNA-binding MarR family transcriptional regulator